MTSHFSLATFNRQIQSILPEFPGFQVDGDRLVCETNRLADAAQCLYPHELKKRKT